MAFILLIGGMVALISGAILFFRFHGRIQKALKLAANGKPARAVVIDYEVSETPSETVGEGLETWIVSFKYEVDGKTFTVKNEIPSDISNHLRPGDAADMRYLPDSPEAAMLELEFKTEYMEEKRLLVTIFKWMAMGGGVAVGLGALLLLF